MSEFNSQIKELRKKADELDEHGAFIGYGGSVNRDPLMYDAAVLMREAADTIESLRDRLQESYGQVPELGEREGEGERESYDAGFENGVKACLQQLDGLIHEGADVDEIQAWVDRQWEEEA